MKIRSIDALEVIDSRGNPTVEARVRLEDGTVTEARVPSGASTGEREAAELRDGGRTLRRQGGAAQAVANVNGEIAGALLGLRCGRSGRARSAPDPAGRHARTRRVSARTRCWACRWRRRGPRRRRSACPLYRHLARGLHGGSDVSDGAILPVPCLNVINGGRHADNTVDFQEFKIAPHNAADVRRGATEWVSRRSTPSAGS